MGSGLENTVKQQLGIKWIDARGLVQQAQVSLGIEGSVGDRQEEVLQEALDIFEDLPPAKQDEMRAPEELEEPEWKRKARLQAEKRERGWEAAAAAADAQKVEETSPIDGSNSDSDEDTEPKLSEADIAESPWKTTSTTTTRTVTKTRHAVGKDQTRTEFGGANCTCNIM